MRLYLIVIILITYSNLEFSAPKLLLFLISLTKCYLIVYTKITLQKRIPKQ